MDARFSGRFANRKVGDGAVKTWTCRVCWTTNAADESPADCRVCKRERSPSWLRLEDAHVQLALGAHVLYRANDRALPAVVISINHHRRSMALAIMLIKNEGSSALSSGAADARHIAFKEVVVAGKDAQVKLAPLLPDETLDTSTIALISEYVVCNECRGIFHVHPTASAGSDQEQLRSTVKEMQLHLDELNRQKQELIQSKHYDQVLALTTQINDRHKQLTVAKRGLERLTTVSCPFCGSTVSE